MLDSIRPRRESLWGYETGKRRVARIREGWKPSMKTAGLPAKQMKSLWLSTLPPPHQNWRLPRFFLKSWPRHFSQFACRILPKLILASLSRNLLSYSFLYPRENGDRYEARGGGKLFQRIWDPGLILTSALVQFRLGISTEMNEFRGQIGFAIFTAPYKLKLTL